jgi:hypothetical protein
LARIRAFGALLHKGLPVEKGIECRIKANEALWSVLLHVRMNECRLRITLIRLWFRIALEERAAAKMARHARGRSCQEIEFSFEGVLFVVPA